MYPEILGGFVVMHVYMYVRHVDEGYTVKNLY